MHMPFESLVFLLMHIGLNIRSLSFSLVAELHQYLQMLIRNADFGVFPPRLPNSLCDEETPESTFFSKHHR